VGYLNWAKNTTYYSSQIFTQVVSRVAFPSISRVQSDSKAVGQMTQMILKYVNLFTFPVILVFAALIPEFVAVVYTSKWDPAIPAFYFYSLRMMGSNFTTLYISVLNALGKIKTSLRILVWWTMADWALTLVVIRYYGFTGIAIAYGLSVIPVSVWLVFELKRHTRIDLRRSFFMPLVYSSGAALAVFAVKGLVAPSWFSVFGLASLGVGLYAGLLLLLERNSLLAEGKVFLMAVFKREALVTLEEGGTLKD
jgi:O-antigen/teichoic acid export membrane protein